MAKGKVLVVDDDRVNLMVMSELLGDEYDITLAENGESGLEKIESVQPDVVLLDIMMPGMDGYEVCKKVKTPEFDQDPTVILVSARASTQERLIGYAAGADDYVAKPFDHDELQAKVSIHVKLQQALDSLEEANKQIQAQNTDLENRVEERTRDIIATRNVAVFVLAKLAESRDQETGEHLERMREYSQHLAIHLSENGPYQDQIDTEFLDRLYLSSPLHDIGKVGIPDKILLKPDRLTPAEFEVMKEHAVIGARAIEDAIASCPQGSFLQMGADIARHHHEWFDGSGYPNGLKGTAIPLAARIVAVADVYDALTSRRPYKEAFAPEAARAMILEESGTHFDPIIVEAFENCYERFLEVRKQYSRETLTVAAP